MNKEYSHSKAALVTGAGKRIGKHIAIELANQGYSVAVHYCTSKAPAEEVVDTIKSLGGHANTVQADLEDTQATSLLLKASSEALKKPIDTLVNNASIFQKDTILNFTPENWHSHHSINLHAPMSLTQQLALSLADNQLGNVINIIDQRVLKLNPQYHSYTCSKAALWNATKTTAQALAPNIRVNAISPGPTLSNKRQSQADFASEASSTLLQKGPDLKEISSAVHFLLETPSMTGQMITLDGGQHLAWRTADILED